MNSLTLAYNDQSICSVVDSLWPRNVIRPEENNLVFNYLFELVEEHYIDYTYLVDLFHASAPLATEEQIEEYKHWLLKLAANYTHGTRNEQSVYYTMKLKPIVDKYRTI